MPTTLDDVQNISTVPQIKSIEALTAEHQALTQTENAQIAQNPQLEAPLKNLQAERYDRIERQKKYNELMLSAQAQEAIESLPLKAQKNEAIKFVETDYDFKNPSEDAVIFVQEEKTLMEAYKTGGNYFLTVKFAILESRGQRQVQINALKKYHAEKEKQKEAELEALLLKTEPARLERREKLAKFINETVLMYQHASDATSFYGFPDRTWLYCGEIFPGVNFVVPYLRGRPEVRAFPVPSRGKTIYGIQVNDLLKISKEIVLRSPHEFLDTIRDSDPAMVTTSTITDGRVLTLPEPYPFRKAKFLSFFRHGLLVSTDARGPGNPSLLITAILDECFPFYADVKSGVKKYPYIIDYGENVPFPNPDQANDAFKKILRIGSTEWAEGMFTVMKKISEINTTQNVRNNIVMAYPKTTDYYTRYSDFSAQANPVVPKPNPSYKPEKIWQIAYNLSPEEAKILWDEWQAPVQQLTRDRIEGRISKDAANAQTTAIMNNFKAQRAALYNKYVAQSSAGYHFSSLNNPSREFHWIKLFQDENQDAFEELSNSEIEDYYSIRPSQNFFYVPKIGYINPYFATFVPTAIVTSPQGMQNDERARLQRQAAWQKNFTMFKSLVQGMATGNITQIFAVLAPDSKFAKAFDKLNRLTGGLISSVQMFGMTTIKAVQGAHISREETLNALMVMAKVGIIVASGGSAASIIGAVSSQLSQGTLGETAFGRAILQLGSILSVSSVTNTTLSQAVSQQAERELKNVAAKEIAKETKLDRSVIGIVATQALVETSTSAALGRDWEKTLIESAKKGSMQVAATLVPGGHLLLDAAFKVYDKGWDSMLPKGFNLDAIENPITALEKVDWKDVGKNILSGLKNQQNKQIIALIATGRMKPEEIAKGVFVQKLTEDLQKKTAMTEYARNPNDPGVKAASEMLATVHLEQRRHAVAEKLGRGEKLSKSELKLLEPAGEVYLNLLKEVIPAGQVDVALQTAMKIGMPDIKNYLSMEGPDLRIDWPFKIPNLNLMDLKVDISKLSINGLSLPEFQGKGLSLPNFGKIPSPDQLTLFDLPKLGVNIDPLELERIVKITLPKGVELRPRIPMIEGGEIPNEIRIIDTDLNVGIRDRLSFSPYEHPMLKYGYVERKLTRQQELYNLMRTVELKEAMLKVDQGELALSQMQNNTTIM